VKPAAFKVRVTAGARDDLLRLFDFLLDHARTVDDFDAARETIDAIESAAKERLARSPFLYRKAQQSPFLRELIVPFRASGYVVLYDIDEESAVNILAVRHQLEDDYH
jgi:plasmid stabilization system protein ParE